MKTTKVKLIGLLIMCIAILAIVDNHCIYGSTIKRIALLPFNINAAEDLSFLKDGIYDMFMTRLAKEGQVEVLSRGEVDEALQSAAASGTVNEAAARSIQTAQTTTKAPAARPQAAKKENIHAHPENVLKNDGFIGQGKQAAADSSGIISSAGGQSQAQFWKSANFKHLINGVAIGDVDGDGKNETVTIAPHALIIYRSEKYDYCL